MTDEKKDINYKAFMGIGVVFLGVGITFINTVSLGVGIGLTVLGIVYIAVGVQKSKNTKNDESSN